MPHSVTFLRGHSQTSSGHFRCLPSLPQLSCLPRSRASPTAVLAVWSPSGHFLSDPSRCLLHPALSELCCHPGGQPVHPVRPGHLGSLWHRLLSSDGHFILLRTLSPVGFSDDTSSGVRCCSQSPAPAPRPRSSTLLRARPSALTAHPPWVRLATKHRGCSSSHAGLDHSVLR